jgi:ribose 5-phosphate isomerase B
VALGSDHAGFVLKEVLKSELAGLGHDVLDLGTFDGTTSVDYPDFGAAVGRAVTAGDADLGVCTCGTGIGISMAANKVPGIRAALCYDKASARNSREHNDSNVLTLGARLLTQTQAEEVLRTWIATPFAGGRHLARVQKIMDIEQRYHRKGMA